MTTRAELIHSVNNYRLSTLDDLQHLEEEMSKIASPNKIDLIEFEYGVLSHVPLSTSLVCGKYTHAIKLPHAFIEDRPIEPIGGGLGIHHLLPNMYSRYTWIAQGKMRVDNKVSISVIGINPIEVGINICTDHMGKDYLTVHSSKVPPKDGSSNWPLLSQIELDSPLGTILTGIIKSPGMFDITTLNGFMFNGAHPYSTPSTINKAVLNFVMKHQEAVVIGNKESDQ